MSEPITLTERERAVFDSLRQAFIKHSMDSRRSDRAASSASASAILAWLKSTPAESASPPRAPESSVCPKCAGSDGEYPCPHCGSHARVESGPGQPTDKPATDAVDEFRRALDAGHYQYDDPMVMRVASMLLKRIDADAKRIEELEDALSDMIKNVELVAGNMQTNNFDWIVEAARTALAGCTDAG